MNCAIISCGDLEVKKITILAPHLGYGGIQKCISTFLKAFSNDYKIEVIALERTKWKTAYEMPKCVKVKYLYDPAKNKEEKFSFLKKIKLKRELINTLKQDSSDIIISTDLSYAPYLKKYTKAKRISWEHQHHHADQKYIKHLIKMCKYLDVLVVTSKSLATFYEEKITNNNCICVAIPNTIDFFDEEVSKLDQNNIVSVGTLTKEKGFVELIEIFKLVSLKIPEAHLDIIGDGPEVKKIKEKVKKLNLEKNVTLHGFQSQKYVDKILKQSSVFVMTSFTEAFGITVLEAFSYGVPSVAFDSAEGAKELISNNWDGYLISNRNYDKMTAKILELLENPNRRMIMGSQARKKALKYNLELFQEKWNPILK